jgi:hypothetical protein
MRVPAAAAALLLMASPAPAQAPPPAAAPADAGLGSPVVEALEVVAHPPGPALWRVTKGQSEVVVLGGVTPLPHSLVWDTSRVERALDGATVLLLPPKTKLGVFDLLKFAVGGMGKARQGREVPMEDTLPPRLKAHFVAARTASGQDAKRYAKWKPVVAGFMLVNDFRAAAGLSNAKPGSTVAKLADARKVPVRAMAEYPLAPLIKRAGAVPEAVGVACLEDAVSQVEAEASRARPLAEAWAAGDLKAVKANYAPPALERCLEQAPGVAAVIERGTADSAAAILKALAEPGKAVAVVDLQFLLRPNGVLDRLKAAGAEITVPAG